MRLEQSFEVPVPVAQAWPVLLDLERTSPSWPGATLTGFDGTSFSGTLAVTLGALAVVYRGHGRLTERDEVGHRVSFIAQGQDSAGAGGASARVTAVLHSADGGAATIVKVVADIDLSGKAAQVDSDVVATVFAQHIRQFAAAVAAVRPAAPSTFDSPYVAPTYVPPEPVVDGVAPADPPVLAPLFTEPIDTYEPPAPVEPAPVEPSVVVDSSAEVENLPTLPLTPPPPGWTPAAAEPVAPVEPEPIVAEPEPIVAAAVEFEPVVELEPIAEPEPFVAPEPIAEPEPVAFETLPEYVPPTLEDSAPPEYHPLALQDPVTYEPSSWSASTTPEPVAVAPEPVAAPEPVLAPEPEPAAVATLVAPPTPVLPPPPVAPPAPAPTKSGARVAVPALIVVGLALIGLIVWLIAR